MPYSGHSRDDPDLDPAHWRTLQVPQLPEVVLVAGIAGVADVLFGAVHRHGNHVDVRPGSAAGGPFSGILPPEKTESGSLLELRVMK